MLGRRISMFLCLTGERTVWAVHISLEMVSWRPTIQTLSPPTPSPASWTAAAAAQCSQAFSARWVMLSNPLSPLLTSPLLSLGLSSSFPVCGQSGVPQSPGAHCHLPLQAVRWDLVLRVRPHKTPQQNSHRPHSLQQSSNDPNSGSEVKCSISKVFCVSIQLSKCFIK